MSTVSGESPSLDNGKNDSVLHVFMNLNTNISFEEPQPSEYSEIIDYYLKNPNKTPYEYCRYNQYRRSSSEERQAYRYIRKLEEIGFLESIFEKDKIIRNNAKNTPNPYQLSLGGILYIIMKKVDNISQYIDAIKNLYQQYGENPLFCLFLYPLVKEETIDEIHYDVSFYHIIIDYMRNICKDIIAALRWLNNAYENGFLTDGYMNSQVFVWYAGTRDNNNEDLKLNIKFFLEKSLNWNNTDNLKICAKNSENLIEIVDAIDPSRNSTIKIFEQEKKAVFRQSGVKVCEFSILSDNGILTVQTKSDTMAIDEIELSLKERCNEHKNIFISQLRTQILQSNSDFTNPTFEALTRDERYNKALKQLSKDMNLM